MTTIQLIARKKWSVQKWKNGQGITNQIAIQEDVSGILWRTSIAEVSQAGHFLLYPGIDRVIMLLNGKGSKLTKPT